MFIQIDNRLVAKKALQWGIFIRLVRWVCSQCRLHTLCNLLSKRAIKSAHLPSPHLPSPRSESFTLLIVGLKFRQDCLESSGSNHSTRLFKPMNHLKAPLLVHKLEGAASGSIRNSFLYFIR